MPFPNSVNITNSQRLVGLKHVYYCFIVIKLLQSKVSCDTCIDLFLLHVSFYLFFQRYEKPLFTSVSFQKVLEKHKRTFNTEQVLFPLICIWEIRQYYLFCLTRDAITNIQSALSQSFILHHGFQYPDFYVLKNKVIASHCIKSQFNIMVIALPELSGES